MANLMSVKAAGRALVDEDFLAGIRPTVTVPPAYLDTPECAIDLDPFDAVVRDCMEKYKQYDTRMDQEAAVELHRALPLSPRAAGDLGIWHYLSVVQAPQFVRHRWEPNHGAVSRERFLGNYVRNTFARLWWVAQLTVDNGNYDATRELFSRSQDLYDAIFGRTFSRQPEAVRAFVTIAGPKSEHVRRESGKAFTHMLTTLVLECLCQDEIEALLKEIVARIEEAEAEAAPTTAPRKRRTPVSGSAPK